jgi:hypothetical protein
MHCRPPRIIHSVHPTMIAIGIGMITHTWYTTMIYMVPYSILWHHIERMTWKWKYTHIQHTHTRARTHARARAHTHTHTHTHTHICLYTITIYTHSAIHMNSTHNGLHPAICACVSMFHPGYRGMAIYINDSHNNDDTHVRNIYNIQCLIIHTGSLCVPIQYMIAQGGHINMYRILHSFGVSIRCQLRLSIPS